MYISRIIEMFFTFISDCRTERRYFINASNTRLYNFWPLHYLNFVL